MYVFSNYTRFHVELFQEVIQFSIEALVEAKVHILLMVSRVDVIEVIVEVYITD